jgi:hypothetical protein
MMSSTHDDVLRLSRILTMSAGRGIPRDYLAKPAGRKSQIDERSPGSINGEMKRGEVKPVGI